MGKLKGILLLLLFGSLATFCAVSLWDGISERWDVAEPWARGVFWFGLGCVFVAAIGLLGTKLPDKTPDPKFRLKIKGMNVHSYPQGTQVLLPEVVIANEGGPSVVLDWQLKFELKDGTVHGTTALKTPKTTPGFDGNMLEIRALDQIALDPIEARSAKAGALYFASNLSADSITDPETLVILSAEDAKGKVWETRNRVKDWGLAKRSAH